MIKKKKTKVPRLIVRKNAFSRFLEKNYGYTHVRQYTVENQFSSRLNSIFLAQDASGNEIFIKACKYGDMSENEYKCGLELWKQAPEHFAKPLTYYSGKKFSFCSAEYRPGKDLRTLIEQEGETALTGEQKAQIVEDIYTIFQAFQRADIVHCDALLKNMLLHNGKVVLVDCQLSRPRSCTTPISFFDSILKLCLFLWERPVGYNVLEWEDTGDILKSVQAIGTDEAHRERFEFICSELQATLGKFKCVYPYPGMKELDKAIRTSTLRSRFHPKAKLRSRYRHVTEMLKHLKTHHPDTSSAGTQ